MSGWGLAGMVLRAVSLEQNSVASAIQSARWGGMVSFPPSAGTPATA